jgi:hypothetical protein
MLVAVITTNHSFLLQDYIVIFHKNKHQDTLSEILASRLQMTFIFGDTFGQIKYAVKSSKLTWI